MGNSPGMGLIGFKESKPLGARNPRDFWLMPICVPHQIHQMIHKRRTKQDQNSFEEQRFHNCVILPPQGTGEHGTSRENDTTGKPHYEKKTNKMALFISECWQCVMKQTHVGRMNEKTKVQ
uniref:Ovule protein n=1 Tax=Steinernema glaseri TaxID=37863 RepID=A0A1I7YE51_9BILA